MYTVVPWCTTPRSQYNIISECTKLHVYTDVQGCLSYVQCSSVMYNAPKRYANFAQWCIILLKDVHCWCTLLPINTQCCTAMHTVAQRRTKLPADVHSNAAQPCTMLSNNVQRCPTVYNAAPRCTMLHNDVQCYSMMYNAAQQCTMLLNNVQHCSMVYRAAQRCTMLLNDIQRCSAMYSAALQYTTLLSSVQRCYKVHNAAQCCSVVHNYFQSYTLLPLKV